jgi:hypothetical protein
LSSTRPAYTLSHGCQPLGRAAGGRSAPLPGGAAPVAVARPRRGLASRSPRSCEANGRRGASRPMCRSPVTLTDRAGRTAARVAAGRTVAEPALHADPAI